MNSSKKRHYCSLIIKNDQSNQIQETHDDIQVGNIHESYGVTIGRGAKVYIQNTYAAASTLSQATLKRKLDADADRIARFIDDLTARRATLEQQLQETTITDEHIAGVTEKLKDAQSLVAEAEGNPQAQRKLIEFLNLHGVLRVDEARERWVDIQFLFEVYPRRVGKQGSGSALR